MSKKLQVLVVFEFDGIDDPNGDEADEVVAEVTEETKRLAAADWSGRLTAVWVHDATMVEEDEA